MPRLSQQTIEKRFQCPYCSVTLRTRQGLSGHVQFKHPIGDSNLENKSPTNQLVDMMISDRISEIGDIKLGQEIAEIQADWHFIKMFIEDQTIRFSDNDYKRYLIIAAAVLYGNRRLMKKLSNEFTSAIKSLMDIYFKPTQG